MASSAISSFGSAAMARASSSLRISTWVRSRGSLLRLGVETDQRAASSWQRAAISSCGAGGGRCARVRRCRAAECANSRRPTAHERPRQLEAARHAATGALVRGQAIERVAVEPHRAGLVLQRAADAIDQRAICPSRSGRSGRRARPAATDRLMPSSATKPPKRLPRFSTWSSGSAISALPAACWRRWRAASATSAARRPRPARA